MAVRKKRKSTRAKKSTCTRKVAKKRVGVAKRKTTRRTRKKSLLQKILDF